MKQAKTVLASGVTSLLLISLLIPLITHPAVALSSTQPEVSLYGPNSRWLQVKTESVNLIFPANGEKPMFLWWSPEDANQLYVVKYKGLIEFLTFDQPYFRRVDEANALRIQTLLSERYFEPARHRLRMEIQQRLRDRLMQIANLTGFHRPYLPFSACRWELSGPAEVVRGEAEYLSFNFTLVDVPFPNWQFAANNVILRCRFYYTSATETVDELVTYTVGAHELKMDLIVKNWTWNLDLLEPLLAEFATYGIEVPIQRSSLALWVNLASIPMEKLDYATADINTTSGGVEAAASASNMFVQGLGVSVRQNQTLLEQEHRMSLQSGLRERFKLRFESEDLSLAGFFKFVPEAILWDEGEAEVVDVDASYIAAGGHLRLFISYPYFGSKTLEHDPSLGLEAMPTLITSELLLLLVSSATIIAIVVIALRYKRKIVNVVGP